MNKKILQKLMAIGISAVLLCGLVTPAQVAFAADRSARVGEVENITEKCPPTIGGITPQANRYTYKTKYTKLKTAKMTITAKDVVSEAKYKKKIWEVSSTLIAGGTSIPVGLLAAAIMKIMLNRFKSMNSSQGTYTIHYYSALYIQVDHLKKTERIIKRGNRIVVKNSKGSVINAVTCWK